MFQFNKTKLKKLLREQGKNLKTLSTEVISGDQNPNSKQQILSRKLNDHAPDVELLRDIAKKLDCEVTDFCDVSTSTQVTTCGIEELLARYDQLSNGDVVSIVSADGYLEAREPELRERMKALLQVGVELHYYYPQSSDSDSIRNFISLLKYYGADAGNVSGFQISAQHSSLFGWQSRFVVFSTDTGTVKDAYLYMAYAHKAFATDGDSDATRVWIRLAEYAAGRYFAELVRQAEPVRNLGVYQNRLASRVQDEYRNSFSQPRRIELYQRLRKEVGTDSSVRKILEDGYFKAWLKEMSFAEPRFPLVRILEVGCGDAQPTFEFCDGLQGKLGGTATVQVGAVESAHIPITARCEQIDGLHTAWYETPFEDWNAGDELFDIVLAIHSMYLIDPSYLKKMYNLLRASGILIVVLAPYENNITNLICAEVDSELPVVDPRLHPPTPYPGKIVEQTCFRSFAEDIVSKARAYFGAAVQVRTWEQLIDAELFFNGEASQFTRDLVQLFGNDWLTATSIESVCERVLEKIEINEQKKVRSDTTAILIKKSDVLRR